MMKMTVMTKKHGFSKTWVLSVPLVLMSTLTVEKKKLFFSLVNKALEMKKRNILFTWVEVRKKCYRNIVRALIKHDVF
jgi:hypothetical protein